MDPVKKCAEYLNNGLYDWVFKDLGSPPRVIEFVNAKIYIFNACTVTLIACAVLGLCGSISTASALILGAASYFGRRVSEESFSLPGGIRLPSLIASIAQKIMKPPSLLSIDGVVIFYGQYYLD